MQNFPDQGLNLHPLHCKGTGPPGKVCQFLLKYMVEQHRNMYII